MTWTSDSIPAQTGRTYVITGANSGIGLEAAKALATSGARIVLAVRNAEKGAEAARAIGGGAEVRPLDLADLASVRAFAEAWDEPIDVLIDNAGVMAVPQSKTADGFEMQFGTNHLGHFALSNLLLSWVTDRVVVVASGAHRAGRIDLADPNWERRKYSAWRAYGQSKLANLLFVLELQRRLTEARSTTRVLAAHPGYAATNLQSGTANPVASRAMAIANRVVAQSAEHGALPTLRAATDDLPGGSYLGPDGRGEGRGKHPTLVGRSPAASDVEMAAKLWDSSEQLTGVSFPVELAR